MIPYTQEELSRLYHRLYDGPSPPIISPDLYGILYPYLGKNLLNPENIEGYLESIEKTIAGGVVFFIRDIPVDEIPRFVNTYKRDSIYHAIILWRMEIGK